MDPKTRNQVIALSGVFQAAQLVRELAWEGTAEQDAIAQSLRSIFIRDTDDAAEIYPGGQGYGLRVLRGQLGGDPQSRDVEVTRYGATLMHLERKLSSRADLLQLIRERLESANDVVQQHAITDQLVVTRLAGIYQDTVSTLKPRVLVNGEHTYLGNDDTASMVRALLLSGIRAAILWRQVGGSRWKLLLGRSSLMHATEQLIHRQLQ